MTAVIYARYSSDSQREASIEGQLRDCKDYAEKNGITVVGTYIDRAYSRSEEHTSELQSRFDLVCRLLLEKKKKNKNTKKQ